MAKLYNLARMSTATAGTGLITLGSPISGFLSFAAAGVADGETISYAISDGANSEKSEGVYTASGTTLTRIVKSSTNSGSAINLSGTAQVFISPGKEDIGNLKEANTWQASQTFSAALIYGGVTLANAVTGTGNMVLSASPTLTGTTTLATLNASGITTISNATASSTAANGALVVAGGAGIGGAVNTALGFGSSVQGSSGVAFDASLQSFITLTTTAGTVVSAQIAPAAVTNAIIFVIETDISGYIAMYATDFSGTALLLQTGPGDWVAGTATPASGKYSIVNSGGSLKIFDNKTGTSKFKVWVMRLA